MLDELPKALRLVLVDNVNSYSDWFFYIRTTLSILIARVFLIELSDFVRLVKNNGFVCIWEIHIAVSFHMMDP